MIPYKQNLNKLINIHSIVLIKGYLNNLKQPSIAIRLKINQTAESQNLMNAYDKLMKTFVNSYNVPTHKNNDTTILNRIITMQGLIVKSAGIAIFYSPIIRKIKNEYLVNIPFMGHEASVQIDLFKLLVGILNGSNPKDMIKKINHISKVLKTLAPKGVNLPHFLNIANSSNIIYKPIFGNVFQFGYGKHRILLDSTITNKTPAIAMKLARNKLVTKNILKQAGIPVVNSIPVQSPEDAIKKTKTITYPVVLKPMDKDGSEGVTAWLQNDRHVKEAYQKAKKSSNNIIIEKHIEMREFRFNIINGELIQGFERIPGGLTGDGSKTIKALINLLNDQQKNSTHLIEINDEIAELLQQQNYTLESIPQKDEFIRLQRNFSATTGKRIQIEDLSIIHQDIIELLRRIGALFYFDVYGVDIFINNVTHSLSDTEFYINEVNGQPQIMDLPVAEVLFKKLLPNNGEIPTVIVVGSYDKNFVSQLNKEAISKNINLAVISDNGVCKNDSLLTTISYDNIYDRATVAMNDSSMDAMIIYIEDTKLLSQGFPIKRSNLVVISNTPRSNSSFETDVISYFNTTTIIDKECENYKTLLSTLKKFNLTSSTKNSIEKQIKDTLFK